MNIMSNGITKVQISEKLILTQVLQDFVITSMDTPRY